jgi:hypothetical protein
VSAVLFQAVMDRRYRRRQLRQTKIQNLHLAPIGDEDIRWLDVAVDDALGVGGVQRVGNLDPEVQ